MPLSGGRYQGTLFRALNPVYARDPLSGRGAALYGGRFNHKGTAALYTALDPVTALYEANQAGSLQPTTLVSYTADLAPIFDTGDTEALRAQGMTVDDLADPGWRSKMLDGRAAPTQDFAARLIAQGFVGLLTRSYAKGAQDRPGNIVLWRWTGEACRLSVIDDDNRLARM